MDYYQRLADTIDRCIEDLSLTKITINQAVNLLKSLYHQINMPVPIRINQLSDILAMPPDPHNKIKNSQILEELNNLKSIIHLQRYPVQVNILGRIAPNRGLVFEMSAKYRIDTSYKKHPIFTQLEILQRMIRNDKSLN